MADDAPCAPQARIAELERLLAEREREALLNQQQMSAVYSYLLGLYEVVPGALVTASPRGQVTRTNHGFHDLLGLPQDLRGARSLQTYWPAAGEFLARCCAPGASIVRDEADWLASDGQHVPVLVSAVCQRGDEDEPISILCIGLDLRERRKLELDLRHAQKLESLGALAAGIAHEINTPMQFIGDNLSFIGQAGDTLLALADHARRLRDDTTHASDFDTALDEADLEFLRERLPRAVLRSREGVQRVAGIVEAMKRFSHPRSEMAPTDLNRGIGDALTVARGEYKYVADVDTDFGALPPVRCNGSDLNQVWLNLLVNAAHAIAARGAERGRIRIVTRVENEHVHVSFSDTGCGIAEAIRHRVFDPFFTTKDVGRGTGQGLSISRSIVVERHGGSIDFESEVGVGTTFHVRLPIAGPGAQVRT